MRASVNVTRQRPTATLLRRSTKMLKPGTRQSAAQPQTGNPWRTHMEHYATHMNLGSGTCWNIVEHPQIICVPEINASAASAFGFDLGKCDFQGCLDMRDDILEYQRIQWEQAQRSQAYCANSCILHHLIFVQPSSPHAKSGARDLMRPPTFRNFSTRLPQ